MIQFNLLPDIKLTYVKAQRAKRRTISIALLVTAGSVGLFLLMLGYVNIIQKHQLSNLDKDIQRSSNQIKSIKDLDKILTVQNQLKSLADLHQQKPVVSRLYTYLNQITPVNVNLGSLTLDFTDTTLSMVGTADSLQTVNKFADTLKFTTYKTDTDSEEVKAFSSVVLSSFNRDDKSANYEFTITFDPELFNSANKITLVVPQQQITTRSFTEQPDTALFNGSGEGAER